MPSHDDIKRRPPILLHPRLIDPACTKCDGHPFPRRKVVPKITTVGYAREVHAKAANAIASLYMIVCSCMVTPCGGGCSACVQSWFSDHGRMSASLPCQECPQVSRFLSPLLRNALGDESGGDGGVAPPAAVVAAAVRAWPAVDAGRYPLCLGTLMAMSTVRWAGNR